MEIQNEREELEPNLTKEDGKEHRIHDKTSTLKGQQVGY